MPRRYLNMSTAEQCPRTRVRVEPDGQEEQDVHEDQDHREDFAATRLRLRDFRLDHEGKKV